MTRVRGCRPVLALALTTVLFFVLSSLSTDTTTAPYKKAIYEQVSHFFDSHTHIYNNTLYQEGTEPLVHEQWNFTNQCRDFPDTRDILFVMKTGASELYDKLPVHLLTHMPCLSNFEIFSDKEAQIGQYHIHDALDEVADDIRSTNREFRIYDAQNQCPVSQKQCDQGVTSAWDLDKFKFLHMIEKAWRMHPDMAWYVFAEADSYVFWPNMVHYLRERATPKENLYVGSATNYEDIIFAHGGSGYAISGDLIRKVFAEDPDIAAKSDKRAEMYCCGDFLVALAVRSVGTKVKQALPMFNGEKPSTLPYGPGYWCEPLLTMHHLDAEEVSSVWQYEQTRTKKERIQIRDMYDQFVAPHLVKRRDKWDNLAQGMCYLAEGKRSNRGTQWKPVPVKPHEDKNAIELHAHESAQACEMLCEAAGLDIDDKEFEALDMEQRTKLIRGKFDKKRGDERFAKHRECFQWRFLNGECCTGKAISLGAPTKKFDNTVAWSSGWFLDGINDWIAATGECQGVAWREPI